MKKWLVLIFCSLLLVGCSNKEDIQTMEKEMEQLKQQYTEMETEKSNTEKKIAELEQIIAEYESYKSVDRPSDDYIINLQTTLNKTLDFIEAINKNDYEKMKLLLAKNATLDTVSGSIIFKEKDYDFTINLNSYKHPLDIFQYHGGSFGNTKETFYITFSFVGGEGNDTFNIETEVTFVLEDGEWKIKSFIS